MDLPRVDVKTRIDGEMGLLRVKVAGVKDAWRTHVDSEEISAEG